MILFYTILSGLAISYFLKHDHKSNYILSDKMSDNDFNKIILAYVDSKGEISTFVAAYFIALLVMG